MKDPAKKELIEGITDLLSGYEEEYVPGEWEAFSKAGEKNKVAPLFPMWMKIAAALFLMVSVLPFNLKDLFDAQELVATATPELKKEEKKNEWKEADGNQPAKARLTDPKAEKSKLVNPARVQGANRILALKSRQVNGGTTEDRSVAAVQPEPIVPKTPDISVTGPYVVTHPERAAISGANERDSSVNAVPQSTADFLLSESRSTQVAVARRKKEKSNKWDFGIELSPTLVKSNVNLGAGITTAYKLSEKFSVSSGVSMVRLDAGNAVSQPMSSASFASALNTSQLTGVEANISAIDIPLGLVYHVNKNFYASAGVSYFNVLNDKRSNTYVKTAEFLRTATDPQTGQVASFQEVKSEAFADYAVESPLKGNSYLGFFNFSVGRQQHLFNRYNIIVEPFVKIPMGKLSDQELKLLNSGVKIRLSF
ncbi:hypothetical protein ACSBL2_17800 [Pedobacter sp. AW31-3R]|uniref:hypothetical protein n=1 Tax=Pedobacter sp. AW31-3R TaxID=3445781 RepID=UPI003FA10A44